MFTLCSLVLAYCDANVSSLFVFHLFHVTHNKHPSKLYKPELLPELSYISKLMGRGNEKKHILLLTGSHSKLVFTFPGRNFHFVQKGLDFPSCYLTQQHLQRIQKALANTSTIMNLSTAHTQPGTFHFLLLLYLFIVYCRICSLWTSSSGLSTRYLLQCAELLL